jgi:hypothetical protein
MPSDENWQQSHKKDAVMGYCDQFDGGCMRETLGCGGSLGRVPH